MKTLSKLERSVIRWRAKARRFIGKQALPAAQRGIAQMQQTADELAIGLLGRDFEERLHRVPTQAGLGRLDQFGFDLDTAKYVVAAAAVLHRVYFRTEVFDVDRVPSGPVLLVANHSGQLPIDGMLIGASMFFDAEPPRIIRSMVERWSQTLPFVGTFFQRVGQVVGVPENARRLLEQGEAVLVFPEGARGVSKPFRDRYRLTEFGLGFMRLALETGAPIVPVAVVGAEEQYINLGNSTALARLTGMPTFPIVPQWLIPGLALPLPTRYRIYFGEPLRFAGDPDDEDSVVREKVAVVSTAVATLLAAGLAARRHVFW